MTAFLFLGPTAKELAWKIIARRLVMEKQPIVSLVFETSVTVLELSDILKLSSS